MANTLSPTDRARLLADVAKYGGDVHAQQERQWIRDAHFYTRKVAADGPAATPETRAVFWIRLVGLLKEVRQHLEEQQATFAEMMQGDPIAEAQLRLRYADPPRRILEAIAAVRATLNEDELLYAAYRRDVECHPWQDFYRLRVASGKLKDERTVFGHSWKIEELDTALGRTLRSYGIDEAVIAVDFARRLSAPMERVFEASEAWFTMK